MSSTNYTISNTIGSQHSEQDDMDMLRSFKLVLMIISIFFCVSCATIPSSRCDSSCTDVTINTEVQVKIAGDPCLYYQFIRVSTFERTVTLEGKVENSAQRNIAIEMARSTPGVKCVVSKLKIKGEYNI